MRKYTNKILRSPLTALMLMLCGSAGAANNMYCSGVFASTPSTLIWFNPVNGHQEVLPLTTAGMDINNVSQDPKDGMLYYLDRNSGDIHKYNPFTATDKVVKTITMPTNAIGGGIYNGIYYVTFQNYSITTVDLTTYAVSNNVPFSISPLKKLTSYGDITNGDITADSSGTLWILFQDAENVTDNGRYYSYDTVTYLAKLTKDAQGNWVTSNQIKINGIPTDVSVAPKGLTFDPASNQFYISVSDNIYTVAYPTTGQTTTTGTLSKASATGISDLGSCPTLPIAPTISKGFGTTVSVDKNGNATTSMSIKVNNTNDAPIMIYTDMVDKLPTGMKIASTTNYSATCIDKSGITITTTTGYNRLQNMVSPTGNSTSFTIPANTIIPSGTCTFTFNVSISPAPGNYTNTIPAGTQTSGGTETIGAKADLKESIVIAKTLSAESGTITNVVEPNETLTYSIKITNNSATDTVNYAIGAIAERVPASTTAVGGDDFSCASGAVSGTACTNKAIVALAPGNSKILSFRVKAAATNLPSNIANSVAVPGVDCTAIGQDCSETTTTTPPPANITVAKTLTAGTTTPLTAGQVVSYDIKLTNSGGTPKTYAIGDITETVPAGTTAAGGDSFNCTTTTAGSTCANSVAVTVAAGTSQTLTFKVKVNTPNTLSTIANTVAVSGVDCTATGQDCGETSPATPTPAPAKPNITLEKFVRNTNNTAEKFNNTAGTGYPGNVLQYCISYKNTGGQATNFKVTDLFPANTKDQGNLIFVTPAPDFANESSSPINQTPPAGATYQTGTYTSNGTSGSGVQLALPTLNANTTGAICFDATIK